MIETIRFKLNGRPVRLKVDGEQTLLWVLRTNLGVTGPKYGCGEGLCGACTVLADDAAVLACQRTIREVDGSEITTIEGLAQNGKLHPLQEAFIRHSGFQCGYCTPGMILKAYSLLADNPAPGRRGARHHRHGRGDCNGHIRCRRCCSVSTPNDTRKGQGSDEASLRKLIVRWDPSY